MSQHDECRSGGGPRQRAIEALAVAMSAWCEAQGPTLRDIAGDVLDGVESAGLRIVEASDFAAYEKLRRDITERRVALVDIGLPSEGTSAPPRNARHGAGKT